MNMMNRRTLLKIKVLNVILLQQSVHLGEKKNTLGSQNDSKQFFNTFLECYNNQKYLLAL